MDPTPASSTAKTIVVPTHSGESGASRTVQATRPSSAGATSISTIVLPEREAISRVPPGSADPLAGLHQDETASVVRRAASTASAGAATVNVASKSWLVSVAECRCAAVAVVMGGILSGIFTITYLYKY